MIDTASTQQKSFLRIENLIKRFDNTIAVDNVSLNIAKGELFALLGSSGCGKSTLLRMLAGFETPTSGRIYLDDQDITDIPPYHRPINMMFQSYALFPHMNVWDNIAFGLRRDALPKEQIAERVNAMLELVQLQAYARRKPHQLSGGQQQRVALARSLAKRPQLLLLDEPLAALDKKLRERTQLEIANILEQVGVTCVMVTHDQQEAMTMASRIAIMNEGSFLQVGSPAEVYEVPKCRFVADFIGDCNIFQGTLTVDEADHVVIQTPECALYIGHGITGNPGMSFSVALRPEKIQIISQPPSRPYNWLQAKVVDLAYLGSYTIYHLQLASGMMLEVSAPNAARLATPSPTWGDAVIVSWSELSMVVLDD